jgi:hypothetical protein
VSFQLETLLERIKGVGEIQQVLIARESICARLWVLQKNVSSEGIEFSPLFKARLGEYQ